MKCPLANEKRILNLIMQNKPNLENFAADFIHQLRYVAVRQPTDYNPYQPYYKIRGQCNVY